MLKHTITFSCLIVFGNCSFKPVSRANGIWFPGKSCGIKTEIKYLSEIPADTSNLACTFVQGAQNQPKFQTSQEPQELPKPCKIEDTNWTGQPYFNVNPRPQNSDGCQEKCQKDAKCEFWSFHETWKWCRFFESEIAAGNKKSNQVNHTIGPKYCEV